MKAADPALALVGAAGVAIGRAALDAQVEDFSRRLEKAGVRVLATLLDNSPAWVVVDLAAERAGVVHVPLPSFFTPQQIQHALAAAGVDGVLAEAGLGERWASMPARSIRLLARELSFFRLPARPARMPAATRKITFTSGTTGTPKGVCVTAEAMREVAGGLVQALAPLGLRRHLSALPFPVLLENVAGVRAPLAAGGTCIALPLAQVGLAGSSSFEPEKLQAAIEAHEPDSLILLPQMLRAWTGWLRSSGRQAPSSLRFVAVGGAPVGVPLLQAARACGIPAYEGYGLSEGTSVQTLNLPQADRPGSAGRPLPHARVRIAAHGEIEVAGSLMAGYLGEAAPRSGWWPTGDLGRQDADGFVHVLGRRKNVLITGIGRNVSPEWVEATLRGEEGIAEAVVYGDAQAVLSAVLWPLPGVADAQLRLHVEAANARLPDYARIGHWVRARAPLSPASGLATANGRPRRASILAAHPDVLVPDTYHSTESP